MRDSCFLADVERNYVVVKIYEAPPEMPDTAIIGRLSAYGKVLTFRRDRAPSGVQNGIRTARMRIERTIPASVRIAGEQVRVWYPDQPLTCRKCGGVDHRAGGCTTPRCFNCEQPGHRAHQCPKPPLCGVCLAEGHHDALCPFVVHSGDVEETGTQITYAAAVADEVAVANEAAANDVAVAEVAAVDVTVDSGRSVVKPAPPALPASSPPSSPAKKMDCAQDNSSIGQRKPERPDTCEENDQDRGYDPEREEYEQHWRCIYSYQERHPSAREPDPERRHRDRSVRSGPCLSDSEDEGRSKGSHKSRKKR